MSAVSMSCNWPKKSPSPQAVRDKVLRECLSKIKAKRNESIANHRKYDEHDHMEIINDVLNDRHIITHETSEDIELMFEIEAAIRLELEKEWLMEQSSGFTTVENSFDYSDSYESDSVVICPVCREYPLHISVDEDNIIQCQCGTQMAVRTDDDSYIGNPFADPLGQLKQRLADVYDKHMYCCKTFHDNAASGEGQKLSSETFGRYNSDTLVFQQTQCDEDNGILHAWCSVCGFHETVSMSLEYR